MKGYLLKVMCIADLSINYFFYRVQKGLLPSCFLKTIIFLNWFLFLEYKLILIEVRCLLPILVYFQ